MNELEFIPLIDCPVVIGLDIQDPTWWDESVPYTEAFATYIVYPSTEHTWR